MAWLLLPWLVLSSQTATLEGVVTFNGERVPDRELAVGADPLCSSTAIQGSHTLDPLSLTDSGGVGSAVVYVDGQWETAEPPVEPAKLTIRGCRIRPPVLGIQVGQALEIHNEDLRHHIIALNSPTVPLSRGIRSRTAWRTQFADAQTPIAVESALHPWSRSYLHVSNHPYYAITDAQGRYTIPGLQKGSYEVVAWHPSLGKLSHSIQLEEDGDRTLSFTFLKGRD